MKEKIKEAFHEDLGKMLIMLIHHISRAGAMNITGNGEAVFPVAAVKIAPHWQDCFFQQHR